MSLLYSKRSKNVGINHTIVALIVLCIRNKSIYDDNRRHCKKWMGWTCLIAMAVKLLYDGILSVKQEKYDGIKEDYTPPNPIHSVAAAKSLSRQM